MIWPFRNKVKRQPLSLEVAEIVDELNTVLEDSPKDKRSSMGPYAPPPPPINVLTEVSVYLAYGRVEGAASLLREAIADPERLKELSWLTNGEIYASTLLQRLDHITYGAWENAGNRNKNIGKDAA